MQHSRCLPYYSLIVQIKSVVNGGPGVPVNSPLKIFFFTLIKAKRGGRHNNLVSTLCLAQCENLPPPLLLKKSRRHPADTTIARPLPSISRRYHDGSPVTVYPWEERNDMEIKRPDYPHNTMTQPDPDPEPLHSEPSVLIVRPPSLQCIWSLQ